MENYPENHRVKWSDIETKLLYREVKFKLDLTHIANTHKRTIGAIKFKLIRYAIELSEKDTNITLNKLSEITNLSKNVLIEGFKKMHYDNFEDNYSISSNDSNNDSNNVDNTYNLYPENHRAKWTIEESQQLYNEALNKNTIENIAIIHKRTIGAIKFKLIRYAIDLSKSDKSLTLDKLSEITNLPVDILIEGFEKLHYNLKLVNVPKKLSIFDKIFRLILTLIFINLILNIIYDNAFILKFQLDY